MVSVTRRWSSFFRFAEPGRFSPGFGWGLLGLAGACWGLLGLAGGEQLAGFKAGLASGFAEFVNQVRELGDFLLLSRDHFDQREYKLALFCDGNLDAGDRNRTAFLGWQVAHTLQRARSRYPE